MTAGRLVVVVGLGSNLGDRLEILRSAVRALGDLGQVVGNSALYESEPVGGPQQAPYLNAAAALRTTLTPLQVLSGLHRIEASHGRGALARAQQQRWGPRRLDLDILWIEAESAGRAEGPRSLLTVDLPELLVPHPRLVERAFALRPLLDLIPDARDPHAGQAPLRERLLRLKHQRIDTVAASNWCDRPLPVD